MVEPESGGPPLFDGLPPAMNFSSPSGFLGRHVTQQVSKPRGLPAKLNLWSDKLAAYVGHVIVKFALAGTRTADLLVLEHLALSSLAAEGLPAAVTRLFKADGRVLMESQRFDRVGRFGRRAVISAGAWEDEHFGHRDSGSRVADRCVRARHLPQAQADIIRTFAAFSEWIGNDDTHFENLSLVLDMKGRPSAVAPAYDLLPMGYGSQVAGIGDPPLAPVAPVAPSVGSIGVSRAVWQPACAAARRF